MRKLRKVHNDVVLQSEAPRLCSHPRATGEGDTAVCSTSCHDDIPASNPPGSAAIERERKGNHGSCLRKKKMATWNVRGLTAGKLNIVKKEIERVNIDLLGVSEVWWTGKGMFQSDPHTIYYSGHASQRRRGVGFVLSLSMGKHVLGFNPISDRIITI